MSVQGERFLKSYSVAGATGTSYILGYISAADTVARTTGSGVMFAGVIENNPKNSSDKASVCISGITKVHSGTGAIARGAALTSDARGYAISTGNAGDFIVGFAEEAQSGGDGSLISIRVNCVKL